MLTKLLENGMHTPSEVILGQHEVAHEPFILR